MTRTLFTLALSLLLAASVGCGHSTTSCIAAGTQVSTPGGDIAIEEIRVGALVYSADPRSGRRVVATVTAVRSAKRSCLEVTTVGGRVIVATRDHPFYCPRTRDYVPLQKLVVQDALAAFDAHGKLILDAIVSMVEAGTHTVYDLTVDSTFHNFLAGGVLVHNKSPPAFDTHVSEVVGVSDIATGVPGLPGDFPGNGPNPLPSTAMATRDPFTSGAGILHITRTQPFNQITIDASETHGRLVLTLPVPVTTMDLYVELAPGVTTVEIGIQVLSGGLYDEPQIYLTVPADG